MAAGLEGLAAGESPATPGTGSLGPAEARSLRRVYLVALSYPIWHLAAPAEAHDPWILWWLVAASFAGVIVLSLTSRWVAERSRHLFPLCSWLVTLHLYWLASINDMSPFYVVASVTAVVTTFVFIRDRLGLLAYFAFLLGLSVTLYRAEPSMTKLAYWGGILTVLPLGYLRLDWQLRREAMDRQMADELERRVDERTREVRRANECLEAEIAERKRLENELRLSHKMEVLGRIAGGLAHDFNNLLATVNVYAELVLDELEPHTTLYADAEQIQKTTRMASVLTQQLLDLSRGSGDAVVVDANDAIVEAAEMVRGVLPADVTFEHRLCARPLPVRAGPDQLGRVLMNLIVNARDAMPEGGRLTVSAEIRSDGLPAALDADPGEEYALLTVTDTGHGMDAETLSRAFDPFFTRKTGREGSGLGLSIVWGIVDQAGGHVRAESRTGQGARFEVFWPLAAEASARSAVAPETAARTSAAGRILLVETGVRLAGRLIAEMRAQFLEKGYKPISPCPHTEECPMPALGQGPWCHFNFSTKGAPEWLERISRDAALEKDNVSLNFLYLSPGGASEWGAVRAISEPFKLHGGKGQYACSDKGLTLIEYAPGTRPLFPGQLIVPSWPPSPKTDLKSKALILPYKP